MSARPISEDKALKALCRNGDVRDSERHDVWLRLLKLSTDAKAKAERKRDYDALVAGIFGNGGSEIAAGLLSKLPLIHRTAKHNDCDYIPTVPPPKSPGEATSEKFAVSTVLVALAHETLLTYAGSVQSIAQLMIRVAPPSEVFAMLLVLTKFSAKRRGAYFYLKLEDERAGARCSLDVATQHVDAAISSHIQDNTDRWVATVMRWNLTLFDRVMPLQQRLRLLDCLISEGRKVLVRLCIGVMMDFDDTKKVGNAKIRIRNLESRVESYPTHDDLFKRSFGIRNFSRKKIEAAFAASKRSAVASREDAAWQRELVFRARHLKRSPLRIVVPRVDEKRSIVKESEVARAIPSAVDGATKISAEVSLELAMSGVEGYICPLCKAKLRSESALLAHTKRHRGGVWCPLASVAADGILLCSDAVLARLRWWRLKELLFQVAGSAIDAESEPSLVYSSDAHGFGLENLEHHYMQHLARRRFDGDVRQAPLCYLLVQTTEREIVGALTAASLVRGTFCGRFDASASLFTVFHFDEKKGGFTYYRCRPKKMENPSSSSSSSSESTSGYALMITDDALVVGGGTDTREALYIAGDFQSGHSKPCRVFDCPQLVHTSDSKAFRIANVELFLVHRR
eukprot:g2845.t1